jgi:hypothetical protein
MISFVDFLLFDFERLEKSDEFERLISCVKCSFDIVGAIGDDTQATPELQLDQCVSPHTLIDKGHGLR